jgi:hypothetical protein
MPEVFIKVILMSVIRLNIMVPFQLFSHLAFFPMSWFSHSDVCHSSDCYSAEWHGDISTDISLSILPNVWIQVIMITVILQSIIQLNVLVPIQHSDFSLDWDHADVCHSWDFSFGWMSWRHLNCLSLFLTNLLSAKRDFDKWTWEQFKNILRLS